MADFSVPALDFGGVAADLDFSLSDVERGGADDGLYAFVEGFADRVFAAYSTINRDRPYPRPVRGNRLWGAIAD